MQYEIDSNGLQPDEAERKAITAQVGLVLSRYNNIVTNCSIKFIDESNAYPNTIIACHLSVTLHQIEVVISDSGGTINDVCASALGRVKRSIERHLKRSSSNRDTVSSGARAL